MPHNVEANFVIKADGQLMFQQWLVWLRVGINYWSEVLSEEWCVAVCGV